MSAIAIVLSIVALSSVIVGAVWTHKILDQPITRYEWDRRRNQQRGLE